MALWRCRKCGTRYAVGLPYCPQCTSTDHEEDGAVAKITVHGGPSDATLPPPEATEPVAEVAEEQPAAEPAEVAQEPAEENANRPKEVPAGFDDLTVAELRERLRAAGLPVSGSKEELVDRLMAHEVGAG